MVKASANTLPIPIPNIDDNTGGTFFALPQPGAFFRACDGQGCGHYGASRDGSTRTHAGVDIAVSPYSSIYSPMDGYVTRMYNVYTDTTEYKGIEISGTGLYSGYSMKIMYMQPDTAMIGQYVYRYDILGYAQDISARYSGITPHVHIEVYQNGVRIDPTPFFV